MPSVPTPLLPLLIFLSVAAAAPAAWAQQDAPIRPRFFAPTVLERLRGLDHDAGSQGPLLSVGTPESFLWDVRLTRPQERLAITSLARTTDRRLIAAGAITLLVPVSMTVLNTRPGKANPFGNMDPPKLLKVLLASFTPPQWRQAGSAAGIGAGDLTDDQRLLWEGILPLPMRVEKHTLRRGEEPGSWRYANSTSTDVSSRDTIRLRLSKRLQYRMAKLGADDYTYLRSPYQDMQSDGDTEYSISPPGEAANKLPNSVYGVQILSAQPRRLKPGVLDFAAAALDAPVSLVGFPARPPAPPLPNRSLPATEPPEFRAEFERRRNEVYALPTVGQMLARISQATRLEFIADRRVHNLAFYARGESARAGDLLMALAWSVAGTYRQVEPGVARGGKADTAPLFLLTDDTEGIGARVGRLEEWAQDAENIERRMLDGLQEKTAKNNPLDFLSFAPGDRFALPPAQSGRVEAAWRREKYGDAPAIPTADLPPAIRAALEATAASEQQQGTALRRDRVEVSEALEAFLLIGEINATVAPDYLSFGIGNQYLQEIAFDPAAKKPSPKSAAPAKAAPLGFAAPKLRKQRRLLIVRAGDTEAAGIVRTAVSRGFTDIWLEVESSDARAATTVLTTAIKAARGRAAVGAAIRLLRGTDVPGEPERNILGETGAEFRARSLARRATPENPGYSGYYDGYTDWVVPGPADTAELTRRVQRIAAVPGLAGLTFRATGAPGWIGMRQGGDGVATNGDLGYTPTMRRAFLRAYGIDPIDIPGRNYALGISVDLGYFRENDGRGLYTSENGRTELRPTSEVPLLAWWEFRKIRSEKLLGDLHRALKKARPTLPLYVDDRVSSYYTRFDPRWFGSWDSPERLPDASPFTVDSQTRADARATSRQIFLLWHFWLWRPADTARPDAPALFARRVTDAALENPPPAWDGLVVDLSAVPAAAVAPLLTGFPATAPPAVLRR